MDDALCLSKSRFVEYVWPQLLIYRLLIKVFAVGIAGIEPATFGIFAEVHIVLPPLYPMAFYGTELSSGTELYRRPTYICRESLNTNK